MVRYAFACRGDPRDGNKKIELDVKDVNIMKGEQFTEHFLCDVNINGEVPVLITADGDRMPESVDITLYFAQFYPSLVPEQHKAEIDRRLRQLHSISFFSLSFTGRPEVQQKAKQTLNQLLTEDLSPQYRSALEHKVKRIDDKKLGYLEDDKVNTSIERAKTLMQEVEGMLKESDTKWCFGLKQPSALDAHLVAFVARMLDVTRGNLIPETVKRYAVKATEGEAWKGVMQGRKTVPPAA